MVLLMMKMARHLISLSGSSRNPRLSENVCLFPEMTNEGNQFPPRGTDRATHKFIDDLVFFSPDFCCVFVSFLLRRDLKLERKSLNLGKFTLSKVKQICSDFCSIDPAWPRSKSLAFFMCRSCSSFTNCLYAPH